MSTSFQYRQLVPSHDVINIASPSLVRVLAGQIFLVALLLYEGLIECNNLVCHKPILLNYVVITGQRQCKPSAESLLFSEV